MMLEVAEAISEGLMMTQLPAAMAPPREQRDSDGVRGLTLILNYRVDRETASVGSSRPPLSAQHREGRNVSECRPEVSLKGKT